MIKLDERQQQTAISILREWLDAMNDEDDSDTKFIDATDATRVFLNGIKENES